MRKILFIFCCFFALQVKAQTITYPAELTVSADGSGSYKTIQEAVNSVRDLSQKQVIIHIKKGIYHEKLMIPSWKTHISLIGEDAVNTIITNNDYSGKAYPDGRDAFGKDKFSTYTSYTVLVQGNDCVLENLTIENAAGRVGQAVALHVEGDRCVIKNCRLLGNQDTLYAATSNSRQLYQNCYIEGTTDFIFGEAIVVFQDCTIKSLINSYITAAATSPQQQFGFVFLSCKLIADTSATKVYLGRPWRPYAQTVFIHCEQGSHILPEGWNPWKGDVMFPDKEKTTFYAEYGNTGAGSSTKDRVKWSRQLSAKEAQRYTIKNVLSGSDHWEP
ncbi:pectinesterase family protein [Mucilaginibacter jinjuensis]|uniref:Pectinesterase n=1 Tax=Mucilaginibacter jinjuensis TaxID=1176721 RepID=A0ABY7T9N8_9SPHI|nr:pectinesterase family protein [Mucilaginibacter jinjuensis]WCT11917.1 pectinesterase family protein [Mucilaginibacter jinjuensis]